MRDYTTAGCIVPGVDGLGTPERGTGPSGWLLTAGIILLVLGALGILGAVFAVAVAMVADTALELFGWDAAAGAAGQMLTVLAAMSVVGGILGVLMVVAGIGVLRRAPWARMGGIVVACLDLLLTVAGSVWSFMPGAIVDPLTGGPLPALTPAEVALGSVVPLITVVGHIVVIVVLARSRTEFER